MKKILILFLAGLILCLTSVAFGGDRPIIKEKSPLQITVDYSAIIKAGCIKKEGYLDCSSIKLEEKFSCNRITPPSDNLGGLTPKVPMVECMFFKKERTSPDRIVHKGCSAPIYNKYIVFMGSGFKVINNKKEFIKYFAPVTTREKALGFAVALTRSYPMFKINIPKSYRVSVPEITTTYVEETREGFKVHLFDHRLCGCGTHPYYEVDYLVTSTGDIKEIFRQEIYADPKWDGACID